MHAIVAGFVGLAVIAVVTILVLGWTAARDAAERSKRELHTLQAQRRSENDAVKRTTNELYREHLEDERARNVRLVSLVELAARDLMNVVREVNPEAARSIASEANDD